MLFGEIYLLVVVKWWYPHLRTNFKMNFLYAFRGQTYKVENLIKQIRHVIKRTTRGLLCFEQKRTETP